MARQQSADNSFKKENMRFKVAVAEIKTTAKKQTQSVFLILMKLMLKWFFN